MKVQREVLLVTYLSTAIAAIEYILENMAVMGKKL